MNVSVHALRPRTRFFLSLLPRMLAGRCSARRLVGYARALDESGDRRLGAWCLARAVRNTVRTLRTCDDVIEVCLRAGYHDAAETLANSNYDANGLRPSVAVRVIGNFVLSRGFPGALRLFERLIRECGNNIAIASPAPPFAGPLSEHQLLAMLEEYTEGGTADPRKPGALELAFARLCFSFAAFDTSAELFERAGESAALDAEDRIAHAYALLRCGATNGVPAGLEDLVAEPAAAARDADWGILLATVLFAGGATDVAATVIERMIRARFADHSDARSMAEDCQAIVAELSTCPRGLTFTDDGASLVTPDDGAALHKIFVCGSGWSGSGALYDALAEYDGLATAPHTPLDRHMNACTESEMTFVQGPAGLGRLWRAAREEHTITGLELWDSFRLHVLGSGAIGYSEHKAAKVASNLSILYGARYTASFRRAYERLAALPEGASLEQLRRILTRASEAMTALFACPSTNDSERGDGAPYVVLNNAIFGPNIDMLEIFSNAKAAIVVRDPLDQFADRRSQDIKHWMRAARFVPHYRESREASHVRRKQLRSELAQEVREIEFERFVLDDRYRQGIIDWLLEGQNARRVRQCFEPERSAQNIGIHTNVLLAKESAVLHKALKLWCRS